MAPLQPDDVIPARELSSWERHLFAGVRMVGPDEAVIRPDAPEYDGPVPLPRSPEVVAYYGSIIQTDLVHCTVNALRKEAP